MSSVVCQGLQSSLEPRLVEPRVSKHRMSPPITIMSRPLPSPQISPDSENDNDYNDGDLESTKNSKKGGWNFIQALIDPSYNTKETDEKVYVHPLVKRSASALSSKSLEMCTESLGCETGSDVSSDEISSFSWEREKMQLPSDEHSSLHSKKSEQLDDFSSSSSSLSINKNRSSYRKFTKLNGAKAGFPPPLTSISGSNGVQVRHHREGGRLIINAVAVSSCRTYFEADRTNGRLRLSLRRECSADCDCMRNKKDQQVFEDVSNTVDEEEQVLEQEDINDETAEDETDEDCWNMDMDESKRKVDCEIGIGEFPRPSRCKEGGRGGKGMANWGPFWVAIS